MESIKEEMQALVDKLNEACYHYYTLNQSIMSDTEYDLQYRELQALEAQYPSLVLPESPTQRVGDKLNEELTTGVHDIPMLSLGNLFNHQEVKLWLMNLIRRAKVTPKGYVVENKLDGLSISLIYVNGVLADALTRGDKHTGERVIDNVKYISDIPAKLVVTYSDKHVIKGEAFILLSNFKRLNDERVKDGLEPFKHPRNAVAGLIRSRDIKLSKYLKYISFCPYLLDNAADKFETLNQVYYWFEKNQFHRQTTYLRSVLTTDISLYDLINQFESNKPVSDIPVDGAVIKLNDIKLNQKLGDNGRTPYGSIAYKFLEGTHASKINAVTWQIGRTNILTPVAEIEPVKIDGVLVSRVTLHNRNYILANKINVGCDIEVYRSGGVIPKIAKVVPLPDESVAAAPVKCPYCEHDTENMGGFLFCTNRYVSGVQTGCLGALACKLAYFVSREGMNAKGIGESFIRNLVMAGDVKGYLDIFNLKTWRGYRPGLQANNILNAIGSLRKRTFLDFLTGVGIDGVGRVSLRKVYPLILEVVQRCKVTELDLSMFTNKLGLSKATDLYKFLVESDLSELNSIYLILKDNDKVTSVPITNTPYKGTTMVLTGEIPNFSRSYLVSILREQFGINVVNTVSKNVDYILVGNNPGSKLDKGISLDIPQLTAEHFLKEIGVIRGV